MGGGRLEEMLRQHHVRQGDGRRWTLLNIWLNLKRYTNRPIVELENAAHEESKITELRINKLFATTEVAATSLALIDPVTKLVVCNALSKRNLLG